MGNADDCNDTDATIFLGAAVNESGLCTQDLDGDGFGNDYSDGTQPSGVNKGSDCDDGNVDVNSSAIETCDGIDSNCRW